MPPQQTREVIEAELNAPLEQVFEWIDLEKPLGSASISQVHTIIPLHNDCFGHQCDYLTLICRDCKVVPQSECSD